MAVNTGRKKLKLAVIGQGRSGRDIHGAYFKSDCNDIFEVTAVVEQDEQRRERALKEYPGCKVYENYRQLYDLKDIDLVVNASFSQQHYEITKDLLMHKFHVLVEKPFARNYYECSDLIRTAQENGVVLAVFQQVFLAPFYLDVKKIMESGKLGEIKQVSIRYNGLARRWDWQTLQSKLGGSVYNTGPHPIGMALGFLDFDENTRVAYSKLDCALTSGDAEDYAKIILTAPKKPVMDIEISSIDAFNDFSFRIQGSRGTFQSTFSAYKMKYIVDGQNPERPVIAEPLEDEEGLPIYCGEKLVTCEEEGTFVGSAFDLAVQRFYEMLYHTLTTGAPLEVTPEQIAQVIHVIEIVHAQNPLQVKY